MSRVTPEAFMTPRMISAKPTQPSDKLLLATIFRCGKTIVKLAKVDR